jgi:hypothetical protein
MELQNIDLLNDQQRKDKNDKATPETPEQNNSLALLSDADANLPEDEGKKKEEDQSSDSQPSILADDNKKDAEAPQEPEVPVVGESAACEALDFVS